MTAGTSVANMSLVWSVSVFVDVRWVIAIYLSFLGCVVLLALKKKHAATVFGVIAALMVLIYVLRLVSSKI